MQHAKERQDRAEAIMEALDDAEQQELAEEASGVERQAQRIQAARADGADPD